MISGLHPVLQELIFKYGGVVLVVLGIGWVAFASFSGDTVLNRYYRQYVAFLNRSIKLLFLESSAERIALMQGVGMALATVAGIWGGLPYWYAVVAFIAVGPGAQFHVKRIKHVRRLEAQADGLILGLANALKTVPSPSAAMHSLSPILPMPMRLEIDRMLKEMRVGSTLEQAILNMSSRVKSPDLDAALSSLLIGLQVGGNLPAVLESTAGTIREMNRLQGVVRTKTSDARAQLWVLALFPFVIAYAFVLIDPFYFVPLQTSFVGTLVTSVAVTLWLAALLVARKVLKVDI